MDESRCIPANPDIIGIGVRTAIYAQTILSFGPALRALADGVVTTKELDAVETQSMTILIIAFAILVSGIVQALTFGLWNYHMNIILDLSWMNNTSTFIYFLLYIRHRTQGHNRLQGAAKVDRGGHRVQIELEWSAWFEHFNDAMKPGPAEQDSSQTSPRRSRFRKFISKFVLVVGSFHLTLMSAMGLWLWSHPETFSTSKPCALQATLLFGHVPIASKGQQVWSLILYTAFLVPFVNLLIPISGFLVILIHWPRFPGTTKSNDVEVGLTRAPTMPPTGSALDTGKRIASPLDQYMRRSLTPFCLGLAILFFVNVFFIADIEASIDRNAPLRDPGDGDWSFGQTLALLLLLVPLRDLVEAFVDREERRDKWRKEWEKQFRESIRRLNIRRLKELTDSHFRINAPIHDFKDVLRTPLDIAISCVVDKFRLDESEPLDSDLEAIHFLLAEKKADPNVKSGDYTYPLIHACTVDSAPLVRLLLKEGALPNERIENAEHNSAIEARGSPLHAAVSANSLKNVEALIEFKANVNITVTNGVYGTPLQMALAFGHFDLVELLLKNGADLNLNAGTKGSAYQMANTISRQISKISQLVTGPNAEPEVS